MERKKPYPTPKAPATCSVPVSIYTGIALLLTDPRRLALRPANNGKPLEREEQLRRDEVLLRLFPLWPIPSIAAAIGCNKSWTYKRARQLHLSHGNWVKKGMQGRTAGKFSEERAKAQSERMKRLFRMERFRILSGMRQRTRYNLNFVSHATAKFLYRSKYNRNYVCPSLTDRTLYYDGETRRYPDEQPYAAKYHVTFKPLTETDN